MAIGIRRVRETVHVAVHAVITQALEPRTNTRCARAVVAQFDLATWRTTVAGVGIAVVALVGAIDDAIAAGEDAHAWCAAADVARLDGAEGGAAVT